MSPRTRTTSPGRSPAASSAPTASVSAGLEDLIGRAQAQADPEEQQREAGEDDQARVAPGVGQLAAGGRGRARGGSRRRAGGAAARAQVGALAEPVGAARRGR